ncbi:MAG: hypothetical protein ACYDD0_05280 [Candidatus Dormibacteria bacterium]
MPAKPAELRPAGPGPANWIFHVVRRRYYWGSVVLTAGRGLSDWGQVIADHLSHDATVPIGWDCH